MSSAEGSTGIDRPVGTREPALSARSPPTSRIRGTPLASLLTTQQEGSGSPSSKSPLTIRFVGAPPDGNQVNRQAVNIQRSLRPHQSHRHDGVPGAGRHRNSLDHPGPAVPDRLGPWAHRPAPADVPRRLRPGNRSTGRAPHPPARRTGCCSCLIQIPRTMASVFFRRCRRPGPAGPAGPAAGTRTGRSAARPRPLGLSVASRALYQPSGIPSLLASFSRSSRAGGRGRSILFLAGCGRRTRAQCQEHATRPARLSDMRRSSPSRRLLAGSTAGSALRRSPGVGLRLFGSVAWAAAFSRPCPSWARTAWASTPFDSLPFFLVTS